jgi:hypothetical protein
MEKSRAGQTDAPTTLDFVHNDAPVFSQHHAFLVTKDEFDEIFAHILDCGLHYWADPERHEPGEINTSDGGRGVYFDDPNGHVLLEIIARPDDSGATPTNPAPTDHRGRRGVVVLDATVRRHGPCRSETDQQTGAALVHVVIRRLYRRGERGGVLEGGRAWSLRGNPGDGSRERCGQRSRRD